MSPPSPPPTCRATPPATLCAQVAGARGGQSALALRLPIARPTMPFAEIALPLPLRQTFVYRVPEPLDGEVRPGVQVQVPFRGATRRGFVVARASESGREAVRDLIGLTGAPPISPHLM